MFEINFSLLFDFICVQEPTRQKFRLRLVNFNVILVDFHLMRARVGFTQKGFEALDVLGRRCDCVLNVFVVTGRCVENRLRYGLNIEDFGQHVSFEPADQRRVIERVVGFFVVKE